MAKTTHDAEADARNEDILIYVDGDLLPKAEAKVMFSADPPAQMV